MLHQKALSKKEILELACANYVGERDPMDLREFGLTYQDIALLLGCSVDAVKGWGRAKRSKPSQKMREQAAKVYNQLNKIADEIK